MRVHFGIFDRLVGRKAWGIVVALVVFALTCVPIGGVVCHAADDVAGMSVDEALSILEGRPFATASPVPEVSEAPAYDPPMLRAASGPIYTPYVSIFSFVTTSSWNGSTFDRVSFTSQPFYADFGKYDSDNYPCYGSIQLSDSLLFYESYSVSDSSKYLRIHFTVENGAITFLPESSVSAYLYFVSDLDFGVYCKLSYDPKSKDFYCKIPTSYFASDGYFYLRVWGYFHQSSIMAEPFARFTNLSINDFIITSPVLPDNLSDNTLNDWVYRDRSEMLDFPDGTSPSATPSPGGGTGGGGSTPATFDPALGTIDDSINKQMEQDKAQHEETKGLLGQIIDGIISIPSKIINMLTDALKALFVPSDDFLDKQLQAFGDSFDAMGFLGYPLSRSIDFLTGLSDAGSSDFTFAGYTFMSGGNFTIPSYSLTVGGKSYKLWDNITWSFDGFFNYFPSEVKALLSMFIYLLGGLCVISYALHMARKYFGVILSDNVVLSVFGSLDNTVLDAMVDDLSVEDQYELDWWRRQDKARLDYMELEGFRKSHRRRRG